MTIGGLLVIVSILPPLVSIGCMASHPDPQIKIREFVLRPLAKFESDSPVNCDSADLKQALDAARFLNLDAKTLERRQLSADLRLEIGDHALKRGCLDFAGEVYREVLSTFISLNYDAQRQRAEVGLKEVKAASSVVETANWVLLFEGFVPMKWKLGIAVAVLLGLPVAFAQYFKSLPVGDVLNWIAVRLRDLLASVLSLFGF